MAKKHNCKAFEFHFGEYDRNEQGWWIAVKQLNETSRHYLRFRSVAKSLESWVAERLQIKDETAEPHPDNTMIIECEAPLIYCPWCGTKLE